VSLVSSAFAASSRAQCAPRGSVRNAANPLWIGRAPVSHYCPKSMSCQPSPQGPLVFSTLSLPKQDARVFSKRALALTSCPTSATAPCIRRHQRSSVRVRPRPARASCQTAFHPTAAPATSRSTAPSCTGAQQAMQTQFGIFGLPRKSLNTSCGRAHTDARTYLRASHSHPS
jgi:hypothetical protein